MPKRDKMPVKLGQRAKSPLSRRGNYERVNINGKTRYRKTKQDKAIQQATKKAGLGYNVAIVELGKKATKPNAKKGNYVVVTHKKVDKQTGKTITKKSMFKKPEDFVIWNITPFLTTAIKHWKNEAGKRITVKQEETRIQKLRLNETKKKEKWLTLKKDKQFKTKWTGTGKDPQRKYDLADLTIHQKEIYKELLNEGINAPPKFKKAIIESMLHPANIEKLKPFLTYKTDVTGKLHSTQASNIQIGWIIDAGKTINELAGTYWPKLKPGTDAYLIKTPITKKSGDETPSEERGYFEDIKPDLKYKTANQFNAGMIEHSSVTISLNIN